MSMHTSFSNIDRIAEIIAVNNEHILYRRVDMENKKCYYNKGQFYVSIQYFRLPTKDFHKRYNVAL
jgi:hypothetical protein